MFFIDSAEETEVEKAFDMGIVVGTTTNPILLQRKFGSYPSPLTLCAHIRRLLDVSEGPLSVQLTETKKSEMLEQALRYQSWDPTRIVVKVPFTEVGLEVVSLLHERGVRTNVTAVMKTPQALAASNTGASYVSMLYRRMCDAPDLAGIKSRNRSEIEIAKTKKILKDWGSDALIIAGSIREESDVITVLEYGADIVTVPTKILMPMLVSEKTERTVAEFQNASTPNLSEGASTQ